MRQTLLISLVAILALSLGCSTAMIPVGGPGQQLGTMPVDVIVGQEYPSFDRSDPFTPVHITLLNNTKRKVEIHYSYFTLVDPHGHEYVIAPVQRVAPELTHERLRHFSWYRSYKPLRDYIFREGRMQPGTQYAAVAFFHQATRLGQGLYTLRVRIPENGKPLIFTFRLK